MKDIEKAFQTTTKLLFGKALTGLEDYEEWFDKRTKKGDIRKSTMTGAEMYVPTYAGFKFIPRERVADLKSFPQLMERRIVLSETDCIADISKKLEPIATFITEFEDGTNINVEKSTIYKDLANAYKIVDCFFSKCIAYSFFSDKCDHVFGVSKCFNCNFCINVHDSKNTVRSFEVDFSGNCADVMFCHNCDNVKESLFCFNTKNLRYAIANIVVGREAYMKARAMLVDYILGQLEKTHRLDLDIYNVGCRKSQKP